MVDSGRLDELQRKFDENPRRYFAPLANEYRKAGETDRAIELCRAHLPHQPGHMSGYIVYGQALFDARRMEESSAVFQQALRIDPENIIALRHLGDIARYTGDAPATRRWFEQVLAVDPKNQDAAAHLDALDAPAGTAPAPAHEPPSISQYEVEPAEPVFVQDAVSEQYADEPVAGEPVFEPTYDRHDDSVTLDRPVYDPNDLLSQLDAPLGSSFDTPYHEAPGIDAFTVDRVELTADSAWATEPEATPGDLLAGFMTPVEPILPEEYIEPQSFQSEPPVAPSFNGMSHFDDDWEMGQPARFTGDVAEPESVVSSYAPEPAYTPEPASNVAPSFVTETMAELYLQQGFVGEALSVYRQLAEQKGEARLWSKVDELEAQVNAVMGDTPTMTVRDFFMRLGARRPDGPASVRMAAASAAANTPSLSALFDAGTIDTRDAAAAASLAGAFAAPRVDENGYTMVS